MSDLQLTGKQGRKGIDHLFRYTRTRGGTELLENILRFPLNEADSINQRSHAIRYLQQLQKPFPFDPAWFDAAEQYLLQRDERSKLRSDGDTMNRKLNQLIGADAQYNSIANGLVALWQLLHALSGFATELNKPAAGELLLKEVASIRQLINDQSIEDFLQAAIPKADYATVAGFDQIIRFGKQELVQQLLSHCYWLDCYMAICNGGQQHGLHFAEAVSDEEQGISIEGLRHPLLASAITNDISITPENNIIFLTGANMAGKSTFMKSIGIAVYLAHLGFPVPATNMRFSVKDGLLTSINLADNIDMGYSHFYAEVLRVKQVAELISKGKKIVVLFDELFRGTNVKDAHEATVAVTAAYGQRRNCFLVLSTHIIEAAAALQLQCRNIRYVYLPTVMDGSIPRYTYQLREGITEDRHGLLIIRQEGIPALLEAGAPVPGNTMSESAAPASGSTPFITDQQTLEDLNIPGKYKPNSLFSLFNQTVTQGGEQLLEQYFREPLTDAAAINQRAELIGYFMKQDLEFPLSNETFAPMWGYLRTAGMPRSTILYRGYLRRFRFLLGMQEAFLASMEGIRQTLKGLSQVHAFLQGNWADNAPEMIRKKREYFLQVLEKIPAISFTDIDQLQWRRALRYETLLAGSLHADLEQLMVFLHQLDCWLSIAAVAKEKGFTRAIAWPRANQKMSLKHAWHPSIAKAIPNDISMDEQQHLIFLTGANMAGKSTIMKTVGICCYLAHMGLPVPAARMEFSVMEGMYTSINVPDNLSKGYSHYYAEVMRVKKVAEDLAAGKQLLVIFDELFKGTNVKDAHDATLLIIQLLMKYTACRFIISTHITEVGHALQAEQQHVQFRYMPTEMQTHIPKYTYRIAEGISNDRHGMLLINNEHVLEMLEQPATTNYNPYSSTR